MNSPCADSRRFIAAAFDAASLDRQAKPATSGPDAVYDVHCLSHGKPATLAATVAESPMRCAIMRCVCHSRSIAAQKLHQRACIGMVASEPSVCMQKWSQNTRAAQSHARCLIYKQWVTDYCAYRSKQAKAVSGVASAAPDVEYNADALHKATLATSVRDSPIRYGNMRCSRTQRSDFGKATACTPNVGPGTYNAPAQRDVRSSVLLEHAPLSRFATLRHDQLTVSVTSRSRIPLFVHSMPACICNHTLRGVQTVTEALWHAPHPTSAPLPHCSAFGVQHGVGWPTARK